MVNVVKQMNMKEEHSSTTAENQKITMTEAKKNN